MRIKKVFIGCALLGCSFNTMAQITWPSIEQQTKPWARWWWQGSAVTPEGIRYNMEQYKAAGLGGLEITPIYGVKGTEKDFVDFLSPKWMELLTYTLKEAKKLGLGIDMANGTGWPFGGPWIKDKDASKTVFFKTYSLNGGSSLAEKIIYQHEGFVRTANTKLVNESHLDKDIAANKNLQDLALDQVRFSGRLPLKSLMAYSDKGAVLDLTKQVGTDGTLNWKAPGGSKWMLYALFEGLHGKMVERAAPGGEGYAIDHFSAAALHTFLNRFDSAFKGHDLSALRALFNDSYEVDDARGQSNWTPTLFDEFRKRRGYDLRLHLPALFQQANTDKNSRVRYDYRATIDELILENFTREWKKWGDSKGKIIRNQSHGSPANLLDLYGVIDIPETEGNDILRFKFATSAAHVLGKQLASSESATWLNEHFLSSWLDVKKVLDLFMLAGVNHIFYHGINYSPKDAQWPGWLFYAAVHFNQANPQWKDFKALNDYVARCQSFLQRGKPDNDILLYFPLPDRYSDTGKELLQHFDGMEKNFEGTDFEHVAKELLENGYDFDFFSDRQLLQMNTAGGRIQTGGLAYQTILLPANKIIPDATFNKLMALVRNGAQVLVYKSLPKDVPGYHNLAQRRKAFQAQLQQLKFSASGKVEKAIVGKGAFLVSDDLEALLETGNIRKESFVQQGLQFTRRSNGNGYTYLLNNRSDKAFVGWVPLSVNAATVAIFDPMTGNSGVARTRLQNNKVEVWVMLQPFESCILQTFNQEQNGNTFPYQQAAGAAQPLKGTWTVSFVQGGPELPASFTTDSLSSWTNQGRAYEHFSGTARYSITFNKPEGNAAHWLLDLGQVDETAEVFLNGRKLATLIGPSFRVSIPANELNTTNTLEVLVSNLMANRIRYMDQQGMEWKKFYNINMSAKNRANLKNGVFDASSWQPQSSGLLGPVTVTPLQ